MKILDVSQAITKLDKDIDQLQRRLDFLDLMDAGIERVLNMDGAFTGEGGEAIILNHAELQLPTIRAFRAHITTTIEKIEKMKAYILEFEPSENGVVTEDFWDTQMTRGLDKVEQSTEQSKQKVDEYAASVSHIMNLGKLDIGQVLNGIESSRKFASEVVDDLYMLDNDGVDLMADVKASRAELDTTVQKAVEWTNAGGPLLQGVNIQDVRSHFEEMTLHKEAPDVDMGRLDRGDDRSLVQGVVNFLGQDFKTVYDWVPVILDGARGGSTAAFFIKEMLKFENTGTGSLELVINEAWLKKGHYDSKLAAKLRQLFNDPKSFASRYGFRPSYLLTDISGLSNINKIGMAKLLERSAGPMFIYKNGQRLVNYYRRGDKYKNINNLWKNVKKNAKSTLNSLDVEKSLNKLRDDARRPIDKIRNLDVKKSINKLKNIDPKNSLKNVKKGLKPGAGLGKNLARGATVLTVGLNFMEAFSDEHKDKSAAKKTGRALAGTALDIGAGAAGATAGAAIGTMIFPGVGTVVGGFVGAAAAGFAANTVLGEPVRQLGEKIGGGIEKAGKAVANTAKKAVETMSNATNLLSGGAKAIGSLFG